MNILISLFISHLRKNSGRRAPAAVRNNNARAILRVRYDSFSLRAY